MKKSGIAVIAAAVAAVLAVGAGVMWKKGSSAAPIEVVDAGGHRWRFVPVDGTSELPLDYMIRGDKDAPEKTEPVRMPVFWIADRLATEGDFATVMGRAVRPGRSPEAPLVDIEWEEAVDFCEKFTQACSSQFPPDCFATLPTTLEWAHAAKLLGCPDWMKPREGSLLFTRNAEGGFLHTFGLFLPEVLGIAGSGDLVQIDYDSVLPSTFANIGKRQKRDFAGVRPVLVSRSGGTIVSGGKEIDNSVVSRGVILTECGILDRARKSLAEALRSDRLTDEERDRAARALRYAEEEHEYDVEDWSGLVALAAGFAESRGFAVSPFAGHWQKLGAADMEDGGVAEAYAAAGIAGKWVRIGDLPGEVQAVQPLGGTGTILSLAEDGVDEHQFDITPDIEVQVLECDFTGDGRKDLVVEEFDSVGSDGYCYDFFEQRPDGSWTNLLSLQCVGLCALPPENGGGCGFIVVEKVENPVLAVRLLTFKDGEASLEEAHGKAFAMIDAYGGGIYPKAPFIGAGYGMGWNILQGHGIWYRSLFWPWTPGRVQGLES